MKIPLNIDWQQILLHLLNFSILLLGLYWLLYNPVKSFMEERAGYYQKLDNDAKDQMENVEGLKLSYEARLENIDVEIDERRVQAAQEMQQAADNLVQDAKAQADVMLSEAIISAQQERAKILEDTQEEIANMALTATEKLLAQSGSGALEQFLDAVQKE